MRIFTGPADLAQALTDPELDPELRTLLARRPAILKSLRGRLRLVLIEGGDTPEVINAAVGFSLTGDDPEEPGYDTIELHGLWFELTYDRRGLHVFVENTPATELGVHALCLAHFWRLHHGGDNQ